mmetsp:Transcript_99961/g.311455  ORF Transcript_99961/g.311455 Transcript_99961/m.311455 type:complete len:325 (-) Transcript_99961:113-1087(-)
MRSPRCLATTHKKRRTSAGPASMPSFSHSIKQHFKSVSMMSFTPLRMSSDRSCSLQIFESTFFISRPAGRLPSASCCLLDTAIGSRTSTNLPTWLFAAFLYASRTMCTSSDVNRSLLLMTGSRTGLPPCAALDARQQTSDRSIRNLRSSTKLRFSVLRTQTSTRRCCRIFGWMHSFSASRMQSLNKFRGVFPNSQPSVSKNNSCSSTPVVVQDVHNLRKTWTPLVQGWRNSSLAGRLESPSSSRRSFMFVLFPWRAGPKIKITDFFMKSLALRVESSTMRSMSASMSFISSLMSSARTRTSMGFSSACLWLCPNSKFVHRLHML